MPRRRSGECELWGKPRQKRRGRGRWSGIVRFEGETIVAIQSANAMELQAVFGVGFMSEGRRLDVMRVTGGRPSLIDDFRASGYDTAYF